MKSPTLSSRPPARLSDLLHRSLNMYALAATAAGVGVLALSQPSEAKIVYTKTHQVIGANGIYDLDLNHDGTVDFILQQIGYCNSTSCNGFQRWLLAKEAPGNAVEGIISNNSNFSSKFYYASALKSGARIGPHQHFISGGHNGETMIFVWQDQDLQMPYTYGKWIKVNNRYLGLKFKIGRKTHYGWARLSVHNQAGKITATLTGYAYETIPDKTIIAGKTKGPNEIGTEQPSSFSAPRTQIATLGMLARGAPALAVWRREESAARTQ